MKMNKKAVVAAAVFSAALTSIPGGSFHSWDFDKDEQRVCLKGILFE